MDIVLASGRVVTLTEKHLQRYHANYQQTPDRCWEWQGPRNSFGYGLLVAKIDGRQENIFTHRLSMILSTGCQIPAGKVIDHLCRNTPCLNPAHLDICTQQENILRGNGTSAHWAKTTHCPKGHPRTPDNFVKSSGGRCCRTCQNEANVKYRARQKQVAS